MEYGENVLSITFQNNFIKIPLITRSKLGSIICDMNNGPSFDDFFIIKNNNLTKGFIESEKFLKLSGMSNKVINIKELEFLQVNIKYN